MKNVAGIFDSRFEADRAVTQLLDSGFSKDDISLLLSDKARTTLLGVADDTGSKVAKGGATGAAIGGALGVLAAGLTAAGSIVLSGGTVLVAGPIVAVLSAAGAGGLAGGLAGALIQAGFSADEAKKYEDEIKAGKAVIVVSPNDKEEEIAARAILNNAGGATKAA